MRLKICTPLITGLFLAVGPSRRRYEMTLEQANATCHSFGARLASGQEVLDVKAAGSHCCVCGWTSSGTLLYPQIPGKANCDWTSWPCWTYSNAWCMADKGRHMQWPLLLRKLTHD